MENKFKPFDIKTNCRVYFAFLNKENKEDICYYERPQLVPDDVITSEALVNAEDLKKKFGFVDLISLYIARTPEQVKAYESSKRIVH